MKTQVSNFNLRISLFVVVILLSGAAVGCNASAATETPTTLKDAYKDYFKIGVAINRLIATGATGQRADNANRTPELLAKDIALVKKHFNSIVAENDMKPSLIHPNRGPDGYVFDYSDAFVKFGEENNMYITGHTLIWHSQVPGWFFQGTATETKEHQVLLVLVPSFLGKLLRKLEEEVPVPVEAEPGFRRRHAWWWRGGMNTGPRATREELIATMREHIHTVVGRYKGKIKVWDVVNEALGDSDAPNMLRSSQWTQIIGEDFIALAFKFAHEADPNAILRYNDYSLENKGRRDKLKKLVKQLRDQGIPIHAIGTQTHINASMTYEQMDEIFTDLATIGLPIHVTELDMNVSAAWSAKYRCKCRRQCISYRRSGYQRSR